MSEQVNISIVFGQLPKNLMNILNITIIYSFIVYAIFYTDKEYFQLQFGSVEHCITWPVSLPSNQ